jgi:tetratricopeptide (TPR) repeat protein
MSVVNGFLIVWMGCLLVYTFYRFIRKKDLLILIPACCQIFALAIAVPAFIDKVESPSFIQWTYVLLGILLPSVFLFMDYFKMIRKVKNQGIYGGLVEARAKKSRDNRSIPVEGINHLLREKQTNEILRELKNLPEEMQKKVKKSLNAAHSLVSSDKLKEAFCIYDILSLLFDSSSMLHYNLAGICYRLERYEDAAGHYKKAMDAADKDSAEKKDILYNLGNTWFMLKKFSKAIDCYEKVLELDPADRMANENLAFSYVQFGDKNKGIEILNQVKEGESGYRARYIKGKLLAEAARHEEAEKELRECILLEPSGIEAREELGKVLLKQNKLEETLAVLDEIVKLKPDHYATWCSKGNVCSRMKRWNDAVFCYGNAIELKPDNYKNYYNMGVALEECGKREAAIDAYKKAIDLRPDFVDAYNNLGIALSMAGNNESARKVYEEGIKINPQDFSLFFNMGMNLFESGKYIEAAAAYRNALDIKPDEMEVYYCLGAALTELRHYNDAIDAYKKAMKIKPADGELHYNIAVIYAMLGRYDIAGENLKQAIELKEDVRQDARKNRAFDGMRGRKEFREMVS